MPDIGYPEALHAEAPPRSFTAARRAVLAGAIIAGAALAYLLTPHALSAQAVQQAGPDLTRLLRAMAGLKLSFAAVLLAGAYWRLSAPASAWRLAFYAAAAAAMAAGFVLIWTIAHLWLGAVLFHGGMLAGGVMLWRDPAVGAGLAALIARRRAVLRARA